MSVFLCLYPSRSLSLSLGPFCALYLPLSPSCPPYQVSGATSLRYTFNIAALYTGSGLEKWNVLKVVDYTNAFNGANLITSCTKRLAASAWKSSAAFIASEYADWTSLPWCIGASMTDADFKTATWGTCIRTRLYHVGISLLYPRRALPSYSPCTNVVPTHYPFILANSPCQCTKSLLSCSHSCSAA